MISEELKDKFDDEQFFLKTGSKVNVESGVKAALNRKGNVMFNSGDIEGARRIFLTTGYSDGISRIGDYYKSKGMALDALRMYRAAPDKKKSTEVIMDLSLLIKTLIHEEGT